MKIFFIIVGVAFSLIVAVFLNVFLPKERGIPEIQKEWVEIPVTNADGSKPSSQYYELVKVKEGKLAGQLGFVVSSDDYVTLLAVDQEGVVGIANSNITGDVGRDEVDKFVHDFNHTKIQRIVANKNPEKVIFY